MIIYNKYIKTQKESRIPIKVIKPKTRGLTEENKKKIEIR